MKKVNNIFSWVMWLLILVGVGLLVWGALKGYPSSPAQSDGGTVDALLYWAYLLVGLSIACIVVFGIAIAAVNDPKMLIKFLVGIVAICVVVGVVYALSSGAPAIGTNKQVTAGTLKMTDTVLNLAYLLAGCAVLAIVAGEVLSAIRNK